MAGIETKILKNNTNVDYPIEDMGIIVPANGQIGFNESKFAAFRQSGPAEQGLNDGAISTVPLISSLTFNNGTDDLHTGIANYYRVVITQAGVEDREAMFQYDKRRVQAYSFGAGLSTSATSYTTLSRFVLRGTLEVPPAKRIVAIANQTISSGSLRLMDVTHNKVLAEAASFSGGGISIIVFTISPATDFSLFESVIEIQGKTAGGVLPSVTLYSLELFY